MYMVEEKEILKGADRKSESSGEKISKEEIKRYDENIKSLDDIKKSIEREEKNEKTKESN